MYINFVKSGLRKCAFMLAPVVAFVLSCSGGNILEAQADLYREYRLKVDTASSCESLKETNDAFEKEIVELLKANNDELVEAMKNGKKYRSSEKLLAKAETEYIRAYLNKIISKIIDEQCGIYDEHSKKLGKAVTFEDILAVNRSLVSATADYTSKYSAEIKSANQKKILSDKFAALERAKNSYLNSYSAKVAPMLYVREKSIYEKYMAKLADTEDFDKLKQIWLFCAKEIAMLYNDNAVAYQKMSPKDYATEKEVAIAAKNGFEQKYMQKASLALIAYQKRLYEGAAEILSAVTSPEELDRANRGLAELSNLIQKENSEEFKWIENSAKSGNALYKNRMAEVEDCFNKAIEISKAKAISFDL